jgi:putative membrane protein
MRKIAIAVVAAFAASAALGACSQQQSDQASTETTTTAEAPTPAADTPPLTMPAQSTADFAAFAAGADMLEIQTSQAVATKSARADVKSFASMIITDHKKTTTQLTSWAKAANVTLPTAAPADVQAKIDHIKNADAEGFDDRYLDTVIDAHEDAIAKFQAYANGGDNADLKTWAASTLPTLQAHFDQAKTLRDAVNKS